MTIVPTNRVTLPRTILAVIIVITKSKDVMGMQVRKVFKAGNSFAVSIPSEWVRQMNLEDQPVELLRNDRGEIIVKPLRKASPDITPDFVQAVDNFMSEYADVLRRLADR
jgi:putative addiction module antidote